jgi:hypothetical protein
MAKSQNLLIGATENYLVTREFERLATREQRLAVLDCLFAQNADRRPGEIYASLSRKVGIDPKLVADQLGHGLGVNLDVYTVAALDQRRQAVEVLEASLVQ